MMSTEYCNCNQPTISTINGEFGYQEVCSECEKPLEDGFHYYDHDDIDLY